MNFLANATAEPTVTREQAIDYRTDDMLARCMTQRGAESFVCDYVADPAELLATVLWICAQEVPFKSLRLGQDPYYHVIGKRVMSLVAEMQWRAAAVHEVDMER